MYNESQKYHCFPSKIYLTIKSIFDIVSMQARYSLQANLENDTDRKETSPQRLAQTISYNANMQYKDCADIPIIQACF